MWFWYIVILAILAMVLIFFTREKQEKPLLRIKKILPQFKEEIGEELSPEEIKVTHSPIEKLSGLSIPYFDTTLFLIEETPERLIAHWSLGKHLWKKLTKQKGPEFWHNCQAVLRLYHTKGVAEPFYEDFPVDLNKGKTEITIQAPGETLNAELGVIAENGYFISLVHSNDVIIPETKNTLRENNEFIRDKK